MKTTTFTNKVVRVTFTKNDKRTLEIYPFDAFVPHDCGKQLLFICSAVTLKNSSVTIHVYKFEETNNVDEILDDEALDYFKVEELSFNQNNRTYRIKGELKRTLNTEIFYPMSTIQSIMIHHDVLTQTFTKE